MKSHFFAFLISLAIATALPNALSADDKLPQLPAGEKATKDSLFHAPLARGINLVYEDKFSASIAIFDSLLRHHPQHPAPYFYKAAAYQTWMSSYRFKSFEKELEENVQKAIETGDALLKQSDNDPWLNFYIGAAYGYRAFFKLRSYNFIGAYRDGTRGIGNFKTALEKDPEMYDVYLGLGSYHYWRTARSKFIRIVAFWMRDKRDLGIDQMRFSVSHGQYCSAEASLVLVTALYDYKKYNEALAVLTDFMQRSDTQVISSYYMLGRLQLKTENWAGAEESFIAVLQRLQENENSAKGYQAECFYWIAKSQAERKQTSPALQSAEKALQLAAQRDKEKELESQFESFDDIHSMLKKLHKSLEKDNKR